MGTLNEEKYQNAILYFAKHIDNGTLGKVKLMKLLYYLDFDHFEQYGTSVTGDEYRHFPLGPVPISAKTILREMEVEGAIAIQRLNIGYPSPMEVCLPLRAYNIRIFAPTEVEVLCRVAETWQHHTGSAMVRATHGEPPWRETSPGATIDYRLAWRRGDFGPTLLEMDADNDEMIVQLSAEEQDLRVKGLALVTRIEEFAHTHPEFVTELQAAHADIRAGKSVRFDGVRWLE